KSSDVSRCVRCVEVANYTFAARLRQHPAARKPQQNRHANDFIQYFLTTVPATQANMGFTCLRTPHLAARQRQIHLPKSL
ncbi:hypothetical protein, partial [Crenobacter intestini]|uniref:hypothetical protein n=1 Tax=Crenobacter intestini TaxID=2563443 RepID=UPI00196B8C9C